MASFRSSSLALVLAALALGVPAEATGQAAAASPPVKSDAAAASGPVLLRVILIDGTALASYGEFARVGDRVIFSMPIGEARSARLQAVNLPASSVNWESTQRYAEAARYAQYVATRAETDFAMLTGEVAGALNEIRLASDPQRRLRLAEQTRRLLGGWPADHYAYRAKDVQEMSALLDETISQIRSSLGIHEFDFSLVASIDPPTMPLLPDPSLAQSIDQSLAAARASDVPAERMALFAAALTVIEESRGRLPKEWLSRARSAARDALEFEGVCVLNSPVRFPPTPSSSRRRRPASTPAWPATRCARRARPRPTATCARWSGRSGRRRSATRNSGAAAATR